MIKIEFKQNQLCITNLFIINPYRSYILFKNTANISIFQTLFTDREQNCCCENAALLSFLVHLDIHTSVYVNDTVLLSCA